MTTSHDLTRRDFLRSGATVAAGGAAVALATACGDRRLEPAPQPPDLQPVSLESISVELAFGESPEEAGVLWGRGLPDDYNGKLNYERYTFDGAFTIDDSFRLAGSASVILGDESSGRIEIDGGQIRIGYGDETLLFADVDLPSIQRNDEEISLETLFADLRRETSSAGLASLSTTSRALTIFAAFWHLPGVSANTDAVREYEASNTEDETDYGWWCEAWSKAGAIAIGVLGVVGCALLLAGCVGTVVLNGLGVVSCVAANIICGVIGVGLGVLVEVIKELVWAHDDDVTT